MRIVYNNLHLHRHLGREGWCDCGHWFNERPSLSFTGWVKLIWFSRWSILK